MSKQLKRSSDKMISGVIAGLADYVGIDHTLARVIYALITLVSFGLLGVVIYIICAIIMKD